MDNSPAMLDLSDVHLESGCQSEIVDLGSPSGLILNRLKTIQMTIPPFSKEIIISFDNEGNINNIVFVKD